MTTEVNVPQEHSSLIGGSTASRRVHCPGSYTREQRSPKSSGSSYAREGTALHEMLARILDKGMEPLDMLPFTHNQPPKGVEPAWSLTIDQVKWGELGAPALEAFDAFMDEVEATTGEDVSYLVEVSAPFPGIDDAYGTSDIAFRCGWIGGIVDWKMGRRAVDPVENMQLMFYFAALRAKFPKMFDGIEQVRLVIIQPQVSDEPQVWETDLERIEAFIDEVTAAVKEMQAPDAPIAKGPWCDFADCKTVCELHRGAAVEIGKRLDTLRRGHDDRGAPKVSLNEDGRPAVNDLPVDMNAFLSDALELAVMAEDWAKHIIAIAQDRLEQGYPVDGWKLVAKASSGREWTADDEIVISRLRSRGLKAEDYWTKKVITPPAAEKILKRLGKELPEDIVQKKPSSGYTMTREGDPRPRKGTPNEKAAALGEALAKHLGEQ